MFKSHSHNIYVFNSVGFICFNIFLASVKQLKIYKYFYWKMLSFLTTYYIIFFLFFVCNVSIYIINYCIVHAKIFKQIIVLALFFRAIHFLFIVLYTFLKSKMKKLQFRHCRYYAELSCRYLYSHTKNSLACQRVNLYDRVSYSCI